MDEDSWNALAAQTNIPGHIWELKTVKAFIQLAQLTAPDERLAYYCMALNTWCNPEWARNVEDLRPPPQPEVMTAKEVCQGSVPVLPRTHIQAERLAQVEPALAGFNPRRMGRMVIHVPMCPREKSRCPHGTSGTLEGKHSPLEYSRIPPHLSVPTRPDNQLLGRS
jgi:hypothetical protein